MTYLAISIGAVLGANARYLLATAVAQRFGSGFPLGTLLINVTGSFAIGVVMTLVNERAGGPDWLRPGVAVGFLGAYTTFSTFSYETLALAQRGATDLALLNIAASVGASLVGVYLGISLTRAIF